MAMIAMTGHLEGEVSWSFTPQDGGGSVQGKETTYLQYVASIHFDHELKDSLTLATSPVIDLFRKKLSSSISPIPLLLLHSIAVVICGILNDDPGTESIVTVEKPLGWTCCWLAVAVICDIIPSLRDALKDSPDSQVSLPSFWSSMHSRDVIFAQPFSL
ncbi:hypothetical protein DSL72_006806 [Monilinia vaccinii-corymbosi]|uniref:Uncharacterized protein n=1 Tax=Monilinia vaccinii-corymbosi TaxID=61207 RepID=A0A8A3PL48_9HELO|nr:hypothetical protein DSL72_006806 [Monilinia vaccinii-corymbosi]